METLTKIRITRSSGDPVVPWALEVPPSWGRPEDVCDGYDPQLDGRDHVPGSGDCDHPFMGLYGYTTWETYDIALGHAFTVIRRRAGWREATSAETSAWLAGYPLHGLEGYETEHGLEVRERDEWDECDECGATIPAAEDGMFNALHERSCSLHPESVVV